MNIALLCLSAVLALAWLPILVKFFRNWRSRANPISLAICFIVAFACYICAIPFVGLGPDPIVTAVVIQAVNAVTCLFFHVAFGWARKRWIIEDELALRRARDTDYPENLDFPKS